MNFWREGCDNMTFEFTVKRERSSVTQGSATVYLNGEKVLTFADEIKLIKDGQTCYGENIGGWASTTPDSDFINATLYHPLDSVYHFSDKIKEIIKRQGATV